MDSKTIALSQFLKIDPAMIDNNYSHYYTINERTVKEGKTPEQFQQMADDFKLLLEEDMALLIDKTIEAKNILSKEDISVVYNTVREALKPLAKRAEKAKERMARSSQPWVGKGEKDVNAYLKLKEDNIHVENILYHLLNFYDRYNGEYCEQLQRAWLGQPLSDIRKDQTVNDGEYLVLTDEEADEWEREGLESLFDDMISEVPEHLKQYVEVDRFVEENSGNRGDNISSYDGEENEQEVDGVTYYIYRHN